MSFQSFAWVIAVLAASQLTQLHSFGAESGGVESSGGSQLALRGMLMTFGCVVGLGLMAKVGALQATFHLKANESWRNVLQRFARIRTAIECIWIGGLLWFTGWFGWSLAQPMALGGLETNGLSLLFWAVPSLLLTFLLEVATWQLLDYRRESIEAVCSESLSSAKRLDLRFTLIHHLRTSLSQSWIILLLPTLAVAFLADGLLWIASEWPEWLRLVAFAFASFAMATVAFPSFLCAAWRARPIIENCEKTRLIQRLWNQSTGRSGGTYFLGSGKTVANAFVVGWLAPFQRLVVSDGLMQGLAANQLAMVLFHEVAHIRRRHMFLRFFPIGLAAFCAVATYAAMSQMGANWEQPEDSWIFAIVGGLQLFAGFLVSVWISKKTELDADRYAVELAVRHGYLDDQQSACQHLIEALALITPPGSDARGGWLHPSLKKRLDALKGAYADRSMH